jgi:lysophospholipid acyltransferase (LPLAT)-like uncharacterized protein
MKIRRRWIIRTLCLLGFWLVRALLGTVSYKYWSLGRDWRPAQIKPRERCIYALWHEYLLVPMICFRHPTVRILVSKHADGLIVSEMSKYLRLGVVHGSSNRGAIEAVRQLLRPGRYRSVAITPDGPRGPRRRVKEGIIFLAAHLGWPIVPVGIGLSQPWRLRSWDRLAIPRPYQRAVVVTGHPVHVPADLHREGLETYRHMVETAMLELTAAAESAAATGRPPVPPAAAGAQERFARAA